MNSDPVSFVYCRYDDLYQSLTSFTNIGMALFASLSVVSSFWLLLFLLDAAVKRYRPWRLLYTQRLDDWGISLTFAHVRCYTTKFNRLFHAVGSSCGRSLCRLWFGVGALTGVLLMAVSVCVLSYSLYQAVSNSDPSEQVLAPVMPGVNMPWKDILYYLFTLSVSGVFHEVGHALAASAEQVRVNGFGVFMLFLYPGAFVDLHSDHLTVISPRRQLRIYCAGVWHNVILVLCGVGLLWSLPLLLSPFYTTGAGAVVTGLPQDSVLAGKLHDGELITAVNSLPVHSAADWYDSVDQVATNAQLGYCMSEELLKNVPGHTHNHTLDTEGNHECCDSSSLSDICFRLVYGRHQQSAFKCLTARVVSVRDTCSNARDCRGVSPHACVFPAIPAASRLVRIAHSGRGNTDDVLFLGNPRELAYAVNTGSYHYDGDSLLLLWLPQLLQTLCMYFVSLSSALALVNIVPAYFLDGQWALTVLVELLFEKRIPSTAHRNTICNCVLIVGSTLLALNIALAIWTLINW